MISRICLADYVTDCCRVEKKSTPAVSVVSSMQESRDSSTGKETTLAASGAVTSYQCAANSSPSKRLSPADVSGTNEEWETASEGSDGSLHHPRRHKDYMKSATGDAVGSVVVGCSIRGSPCTSGVPSLGAATDSDHSWKDTAGLYSCHLNVGSSATQHDLSAIASSANTNTDCAIVAVNQSTSAGSRLFPAPFGDPDTKQLTIHDSLARFASALIASLNAHWRQQSVNSDWFSRWGLLIF